MHKENKNNNFIQRFLLLEIMAEDCPGREEIVESLLSMQVQKVLVFHQKYLTLFSHKVLWVSNDMRMSNY